MVSETTVFVVISFAVLRALPPTLCWKRGENSVFFDGAVFWRRNFALQADILKRVKTPGELQCSFACLSEKDCIAQTYCTESWDKNKGTCYLHKNGIKGEQTADSVLVRRNGCIFQQYINFYEAICSRQCHNGNKCEYDHNNRRYTCCCDPPYYGMYCEKTQVLSFRFTTLGMQGSSGPTSTAGYTNTSLHGTVTLNKGIQTWTVPLTALYTITVAGASGGDTMFKSGGHGAVIKGTVQLTKGTILHLLIGQKGLQGNPGAGGGGGTFVVFSDNTPLAIAGGGGGGGGYITAMDGDNGQTSRNGSVHGGANGLGGLICATEVNEAGGGGGFQGDGKCSNGTTCAYPRSCDQAGKSYLNGGLGGTGDGNGGFGGGGAASGYFQGGGGGYSGGGVNVSSLMPAKGGGGGSYYTGELKPNFEFNTGDGYVAIAIE